jgi:hypothetical protein
MNGPDHRDWEDDPVWKLLDEAKGPGAGPLFVRNVMRDVRLSEAVPTRWWQHLLTPKPLLAGALGTAAAVLLLVSPNPGTASGPDGVAQTTEPPVDPPIAESSPLEELLKEEMLFAAAENPAAFTDEALLDLLD